MNGTNKELLNTLIKKTEEDIKALQAGSKEHYLATRSLETLARIDSLDDRYAEKAEIEAEAAKTEKKKLWVQAGIEIAKLGGCVGTTVLVLKADKIGEYFSRVALNHSPKVKL